ncbi:diaminopimelate epimerase [Methylotenera sp.]|uniref:diaminopimelate epimerase n=1 Tax=Methylotenera sp. TaxID=2051956 RepID=UPI002718E347|nr:diaminopimelate epimerase [Methylotenera sp.]MDO9204234.1 diaminopimelate epimerase [Methylotenera sp.]MDP2070333.1 diaminopimelate epimerase [Methylotenera sp.]MDP3004548.1 diaminopimelate epimerase [Methylotenera sp.]
MNLKFTKMHGAGNDFMVIDGISQSFALTTQQIQTLAHRQFGVGFDQLLLVELSKVADFKYRIFNADGSEVSQCGNGARCFVRFVVDQHLTDKHEINVETASGIITPKLEENGLVTVNMGAPGFAPSEIPFVTDAISTSYSLEVGGQHLTIAALSMGNPHAVQIIDDVEAAPVATLGSQIEVHPRFPERVNAGFMQIIDTHHIKLRVFERGSGETLACGTGACAAVVAGIQLGRLQSPVKVTARGGELHIAWQGGNSPVMMTGPAVTVFTGTITLI